jgi:hypothetical protein
MKEHPASRNFYKATRSRTGTQAEIGSSRRRKQVLRTIAPGQIAFHPAREFMIDLGWLRLFRKIFSPGVVLATEEFRHE